MAVDPGFTSTQNYPQTTACRCQLKTLSVGVKDAVADNTRQVVIKIFCCIGSVKVL